MVALVVGVSAAFAWVGGAAVGLSDAGSSQRGWEPRNLGTLGGRQSEAVAANRRGQVVGISSLVPNTTSSVAHAFVWEAGRMRDVGGFNAKRGTRATGINDRGDVIGTSTPWKVPECFLWRDGRMRKLGSLGGAECLTAKAINERGQIVGSARTADRNWRAFLWQNGRMRGLGTLGGPFSGALAINERGQIVGEADTDQKDGRTSIRHAFLWENGKMRDLGTLGGNSSEAAAINAAGQVVGWSDVQRKNAPDRHAFLWENGKMSDLGALGGSYSEAIAINDRGQIVGWAETESGERHAFLWEKGRMHDLGTLGGYHSDAVAVNEKGQVVGLSQTAAVRNAECERSFLFESDAHRCPFRAVLWEGGEITDLGTLGGASSSAKMISETGQIVGWGMTARRPGQSSVRRAVLWMPDAP